MSRPEIVIRGAREHNLRDVSLTLPKNKLIVMTGVSGSGKSSLAFDTLYAEGQRRYVESLSSYARQFLGQMPKPDVDSITGLAPSISIEQKTAGRNPRSTVGTITEVYDYLRVLFARVGQGYCYVSGLPIRAQSTEQIIESIARTPEGTRLLILAPLIQNQKGEYRDLFEDLLKQGFLRARVDGEVVELNNPPKLKRHFKHTIEVVADRLSAGKTGRTRLAEAIESALKLGKGTLIVAAEASGGRQPPEERSAPGPSSLDSRPSTLDPNEKLYSANYSCPESGMSYEPPTPQLFSFNSPLGMCPDCTGLGMRHEFVVERLVDDEKKSLAKGALHLMRSFREMGRWQRHLYEGAAAAIEEDLSLKPGSLLKTSWKDLAAEAKHRFLHGTGDRHVTFAWRHRGGVWKHGGTWSGFLPKLLEDYRDTKNPMRRRQLEKYMDFAVCSACEGSRLNRQARNVRLRTASERFLGRDRKAELSLPEVCGLSIADAYDFFENLVLDETQSLIAGEAVKEIRGRLGFLLRCGLDYLALERTAPTLSGGESQRIRLAGQIGCGLVGVVYILDEPSIGLHPRDNTKLLESLLDLRDQGNTVVVVEHDEETMRAADLVVDFGPGPGVRGGEIVALGSVDDVKASERSVTGQYLSGTRRIEIPAERRKPTDAKLTVRGATHHNLKGVDVEFPLGLFVCVTGVSGSGKSSLVNDILWPVLNRDVNQGLGNPGPHVGIDGLDRLDKAIDIDQSPIGRTPRSNPATYAKVFDHIRDLYTNLPQAKLRGYPPGRFSFNVEGGRCEACEGHGATKLEMDFLADIWVPCPVCEGHRFSRETLEVKFKDKSIADVLEMDIQQALEHFENVPKIHRLLQALHDVGLDYLKLGQPSPTLSGGEAQRVKLARELGKRSTGRTIYLLDEPTTGLHFADVHRLLDVLHSFVAAGNTVLVVEHNLDVIKTADWVIDLGPEGGEGGGTVVAAGTPEQVAACEESYTGRALRGVLPPERLTGGGEGEKGRGGAKKIGRRSKTLSPPPPLSPSHDRWQIASAARTTNGDGTREITIRGAAQHNLQSVDVDIPRDRMSVFCGPSGSGKSSLAMDTLYAEGQRRYVESLSAYARQFLGQMPKPKVEHVHGLSPAIAIEQKTVGHTPRSTVGTVTEIYDYLRLLFARLGTSYCPACDVPVGKSTTDEIIEKVLALGEGGVGDRARRGKDASGVKALLLAPQVIHKGESYKKLFDRLRSQGFGRVRINGKTHEIADAPTLDHRGAHGIEVVVDRITIDRKQRGRIAESIESALDLGRGVLRVALADPSRAEDRWEVKRFSLHASCDSCGRSFEPLTPQNFSFNSPLGWCAACEGLGVERGTDQSALIANPHVSLRDGAIAAWPDPKSDPLFAAMLEGMGREIGLPLDTPFDRLEPAQQRIILYGSDRWVSVISDEPRASATAASPKHFRFQYKGLYPALNEAARVSYIYRTKLRDFVGEQPCSACSGDRIRDDSAAVRLRNLTLPRLCRLPLGDSFEFLDGLKLAKDEKRIAGDLLTEAKSRLKFLVDVGLEYLTLDRTMPTLSGGESQRIRLAGQIGRALTGVLYVLDEPTIGLHPRDNNRLLSALKRLRDLGNTVVLVEHDREVIEAADRVYDFGPGSGRLGGKVTAQGTPNQIAKSKTSLTGRYLSDSQAIPIPTARRVASEVGDRKSEVGATKRKTRNRADGVLSTLDSRLSTLELLGCRHHNLRNVDLRIPLGTFVCVTGVSGSGKSSLIEGTLAKAVARRLHQAGETPGPFAELKGVEHLSKVIAVDQQPLGSTPASNPATYTGVFDLIRELFARMPEAKVRGYKPARFSFNRPGGRCEDCEGLGQKKIEMHFLPDVWVTCDTCKGHRYNTETLAVTFKGKTIADVLELSISQAYELFQEIPKIRGPLAVLCAIGLDYLTLGQPAPTLSGGEAQRVKLAAELARPHGGRTLYLLDEPTTGLHFDDIAKLLKVLNSLVDQGNTVLVIEHNLDVIKNADWVIDLGPEAGAGGGWIVAQGTPEDIVVYAKRWRDEGEMGRRGEGEKTSRKPSRALSPPLPLPPSPPPEHRSHTGEMLAPVLEHGVRAERESFDVAKETKAKKGDVDLAKVGRGTKMPWQADGRRWHVVDRISHDGAACRWEGEALELVLDEIANLGGFAEPNFNHRSVVEILPESKAGGWFLHAHTAHEWWVKFTFRVKKNSFDTADLARRIPLPVADDLDLPVYGRDPRVEAHNLKLPWQEVNFKIHWKREIDLPAFREFLKQAKAAFFAQSEKAKLNTAELTPWKVLGKKWHLSKKGFSSPPVWEPAVLERLVGLLGEAAPEASWDWEGKQSVCVRLNGDEHPFAEIHTKRPGGADLVLTTESGRVTLGRVANFGYEREVVPHRRGEAVRIRFTEQDQLRDPAIGDLLTELAGAVAAG